MNTHSALRHNCSAQLPPPKYLYMEEIVESAFTIFHDILTTQVSALYTKSTQTLGNWALHISFFHNPLYTKSILNTVNTKTECCKMHQGHTVLNQNDLQR